MKTRSRLSAAGCFGVDSQGDRLTVVWAERSRGRLRFTTLPGDNDALRQAVGRGAPVAACLTARESFARWVEAPYASPRKAERVLPTLLDIQLPFALEDCRFAFPSSRRTSTGTVRALAVGARRADLQRAIEAFRQRGIDPWVLDHEGLALWTASLLAHPASGSADAWRVVIHLGLDRWTVVLGRGEEPLSVHGARPGDVAQVERLVKTQTDRPGEAVGAAAPGGEALPAAGSLLWIWAGPGADGAALADYRRRLEGAIVPSQSVTCEEPGTFLARALAARALLPGPLRCNLRGGDLAHAELRRQRRRRAARAAWLCLLAGLVVCGMNAGARLSIRSREAAIDAGLCGAVDGLVGYRVPARGEHAVKIAERESQAQAARYQPFLDALSPGLASLLADVVEVAARSGLSFEHLTLSRGSVAIAGTAVERRGADELGRFLEQAGFPIKVEAAAAAGAPGTPIPFSVASVVSHE